MITEKLIVGVFVLLWRVVKTLGIFAIGGQRRPVAGEAQIADAYWVPQRRRGFGDALTWTTVLALLGIGVPLASTDPAFSATATQDFHALLQLAGQIADRFIS